MKYLRQLCVILAFTFAGEALHSLLPFPIPAAIYGLVLLFLALCLGLVRQPQIAAAADFLLSIMPLLFIAPAVALLEQGEQLAGQLLPILAVVVLSTLLTFAVAGCVTQAFLRRKGGKADE